MKLSRAPKLILFGLVFLLALPIQLLANPPVANAAEVPLVIVFDTSGSMSSTDRNGQVKLETAKTAMTDLVHSQPGGIPLGLWTYPGGSSDGSGCEAGGWYPDLAPDQKPDKTSVNARIRELSSGGDTPTGPALAAVADSLRDLGYDAATILLVTDGESNCGQDPCEVAKQIVASGFDLTVAAVAFDLESGDTGELTCIADATGGSFHTADDADELLEAIQELHQLDLELKVDAVSTVFAGDLAYIEATVENPTSQPFVGGVVRLLIDAPEFVPYVQAPRRALPALGSGDKVKVGWTVGTLSGKDGSFDWTVFAGKTGSAGVSETGSIRVSSQPLTRADGGPLVQGTGGTILVLGDSYSSGEGTKDYLSKGEPACHRSKFAYGPLIGGESTEVIACSGAISMDFYSRQHKSEVSQIERLRKIVEDANPDVVFLTVGGNDIGFGGKVLACFLGDCAEDRLSYLRDIEGHAAWSDVYEDVARIVNTQELVAARGGALAPVLVSPYPDLLWDPLKGSCNSVLSPEGSELNLTPEEVQLGKEMVRALNDKVEEGVLKAQEHGYPVYFVDKVEAMAVGHSVCEQDSYFVPITVTGKTLLKSKRQEMFHPNKQGHRAWANSIISWSQRPNQKLVKTMPARLDDRGSTLLRLVDSLKKQSHSVSATLERPMPDGDFNSSAAPALRVTSGSFIEVQTRDLFPGSSARITVQSSTITLGIAEVDESGSVLLTATLPELDSGIHNLVVSGYNDDYQLVGLKIPLQVTAGIPWFFVALGVLAFLSLVALIWSGWKWRRSGR